MSQSSFGKKFVVTTWGESHGKAIGAVLGDQSARGGEVQPVDFADARQAEGQARHLADVGPGSGNRQAFVA